MTLRKILLSVLLISTTVLFCGTGWGADSDITNYGSGSHTITPVGTATSQNSITNVWEYCYDLDGNSDYLSVPDSTDWELGSSDFTWVCFAYMEDLPATGEQVTLITRYDETPNRCWELHVRDDAGVITMRMYYSTTGLNLTAVSSSAITPSADTWHQYAAVRDGNTLRFYFDGNTAGTADLTGITFYDNNKAIFIGASVISSPTRFWNGNLDDVRYFSSALTSGNITTLYGAGSGTSSAIGGEVFWMHSVNAVGGGYSDNDTKHYLSASQPDTLSLMVDGTDQVEYSDGAIIPATDNDIDLGDATHEFKDLYIDGTAYIDAIDGAAIDSASNTLTLDLSEGTLTGTIAEFNTACSDQDFAYSGGAFHDGFSDFVANEHIDWTASQAPTVIHADNYTDTDTDDQTIDVSELDGTTLKLSLEDDGEATKEIDLSSLQDGTGTDDQTIDVLSFDGTDISISLEDDGEATKTLDISSVDTDTNLTEEEVEDFVGGMLGGTETLISVTYEDATNDIDFVVDEASIDHDALTNFTATEHFTMLDEDNMATDSDTQAATQQSIKAYVDAEVLKVEGTEVLSTGEGGGTKFLREDGDGTCSWQVAVGVETDPIVGAISGIVKADGGGNISAAVADTDYLVNIVADTTPQLGANLECQEYHIDDVGNLYHDDSTASDWYLDNQDQDKDIHIRCNDGGTTRTAIQVYGDSGAVGFPRQSMLEAYKGDQTIGTSSTTTVTWTSENKDNLGNFASNTFTVPENGFYLVSYVLTWANCNSGAQYQTGLNMAGDQVWQIDNVTATSGRMSQSMTRVKYMTSGQTIYVNAWQNSGGNETLEGTSSSRTRLSIIKVA